MKVKLFTIAILILLSCNTKEESKDQEQNKVDFSESANRFHQLYITAGNCEERNSMIDNDIVFLENQKTFSYQDILEYCNYIQPKNPFDIYSKQYLVQPNVGFDYVDQSYLNSEKDTIREISSRIWELKDNSWVVTYMQVSRHN